MEERKKGHIDWFILLPVLALMLFSISFVQSASSPISMQKSGFADRFYIRHLIMVLVGIGTMITLSQIDYNKYRKFTKVMLGGSITLLILVLFVGIGAKGASRWIGIGPIQFQPSELAKFALIAHFANLLANGKSIIRTLEFGFIPLMIWMGAVCLPIAFQPNFSAVGAIIAICFTLMIVGGVRWKHLWISGLVIFVVGVSAFLSASYRMNRVLTYLGMGEGAKDMGEKVGYQANQALLAIGNGGIFGVGPGQSRQSHLFLPESYGDFIFSVIGEEYGFIGLTAIIALYATIVFRGFKVAKNAPNAFGYYLATGIITTFSIYVMVNAGVNTSLLPTTGVPFPFLSYGGTAVVIYSAAIGVLLNISAQSNIYPRQQEEDDQEDKQEELFTNS